MLLLCSLAFAQNAGVGQCSMPNCHKTVMTCTTTVAVTTPPTQALPTLVETVAVQVDEVHIPSTIATTIIFHPPRA